jgi:prophage antirepressor-like protein|tara:strand:+ start:834 stop:1520 length:687 start_codon:yes stop_codon:yes gene_type:complete
MNILNLEKGISLYKINNKFYFDLEDMAKKLGYARPKVAVNDFLKRNADFQSRVVTHDDGRKLYDESTIYFFLGVSVQPNAREWLKYICIEVLPLVRKVGLKAIKELHAMQTLAKNKLSPDLYSEIEELVGDETEQFLIDNNAYRVLGYLPPSEVKPAGWSLAEFWEYVEEEGIDNFNTIYCAKYHNSYTLDGKWYAFKDIDFPEIPQEIPEKPEITQEIPCFSASDLI